MGDCMNKEFLYAENEFANFCLRTQRRHLEDDFLSATFDITIELRCPKCNRQLTEDEYSNNKLQQTDFKRKVKELEMNFDEVYRNGNEDCIRYFFEHKRCPRSDHQV